MPFVRQIKATNEVNAHELAGLQIHAGTIWMNSYRPALAAPETGLATSDDDNRCPCASRAADTPKVDVATVSGRGTINGAPTAEGCHAERAPRSEQFGVLILTPVPLVEMNEPPPELRRHFRVQCKTSSWNDRIRTISGSLGLGRNTYDWNYD